MYAFAMPSGYLTLRPCAADKSICELWLNQQRVALYSSASAAAGAVNDRCTGFAPIDNAPIHYPRTIDTWTWISIHPVAAARTGSYQ